MLTYCILKYLISSVEQKVFHFFVIIIMKLFCTNKNTHFYMIFMSTSRFNLMENFRESVNN